MNLVVQIDGKTVPADKACISVFDRGFLYGDSVFETVRTYGGRPFALDDHLGRLERSARLVYIELPVPRATLKDEVNAAVTAARAHFGEQGGEQSSESRNEQSGEQGGEQGEATSDFYVRIIITRGQGELGLDPALASVARRVVIVGPLNPPPVTAYQRGVAVVTYRTQRPSDATQAEGAKIGNYLVAVLGVRAAREAGAHEALIVGSADRVVEGASSNVFCVKDSVLITPPLEAGILAGITRDRVLRVASQLNVPVRYESPTVSELLAMDEVFISSSIRELLPVVRIDEATVGGGAPGPITLRLHQAFRRTVEAEMGL